MGSTYCLFRGAVLLAAWQSFIVGFYRRLVEHNCYCKKRFAGLVYDLAGTAVGRVKFTFWNSRRLRTVSPLFFWAKNLACSHNSSLYATDHRRCNRLYRLSAVTGYISVAFLLSFVQRQSLAPFVWYRIVVGGGLIVAILAGFKG